MKTTDFITEGIGQDADDMHKDHEVQMARQDCYNAAKNAIDLHKLLATVSEMQGLEGWVSEKITLAADYLKTVKEYFEYEQMSQEQSLLPEFTFENAEAQMSALLEDSSDEAIAAFLAKGGEIKHGAYKKPRKADKTDYGSKHIGGAGDRMRASRTGVSAKTQGNKIVGMAEEQLDELSPELLARYKTASSAASSAADKAGDYDLGHKRYKGIIKATKKQFAHDMKKHQDKERGVEEGSESECPRCHSADIKTYSNGEKECHQCHKTWDVEGVAEGVAETLSMDEAKKVLSHYGAGHFKTSSEALHFYKNGRPFSVDLVWGNEGERSVSLSQLNSVTRQLKGQGLAENRVDSPVSSAIIRRILDQRPGLLKYGPQAVMDAVDQVADWVGEVEEIGTSDVSGWVDQVTRYLRTQAGEGIAESAGATGAGGIASVVSTLGGKAKGPGTGVPKKAGNILKRVSPQIGKGIYK